MIHRKTKSVAVVKGTMFLCAIVEAKRLLVQIAEQVERLDANVRSADGPLQERPEILKAVRVDTAIHVLRGMIDYLVRVERIQAAIRLQFVSIERTSRFYVLANICVQPESLDVRNGHCADFATTFENAKNSGLIGCAASADTALALRHVHVTSLAADESLVRFNFFARAAELRERLILHGEANAVHHEPSRLLRDSERPRNFVRTDSVLGIHNQPDRDHPLVHAECRVLENRADFDSELLFASLTEPYPARRNERVLHRATARTRHRSVRPAQLNGIVKSTLRVREENHCLLQRFRESQCAFHERIMTQKPLCVKYVVTFCID